MPVFDFPNGDLAVMLGPWRRGGGGYLSLATALRSAILDGRLSIRAALPSERALATMLGVSRTTTTAAYDILRSEGFIESRRGSGSRTALPPAGAGERVLGGIAPLDFDGVDVSAAALPAPAALLSAVSRAVGDLPAHLAGHGYAPLGLQSLRGAIAKEFSARGLPTSEDQVIVTSGAQSALAMLLDTLAAPGDTAVVEAPTYPNALEALRRAGVRLTPAPLGSGGWDMDVMSALFRRAVPQLAYVIPDFHNPTGQLMPNPARAALVAEAERAGTQLIVDETSVDIDLTPHRLMPKPLATHGSEGRVITIGSISKSFWGGLRVGWIRAPQPVIRRLARVRAARDLATPVLDQLVATHLLAMKDEVLPERQAMVRERRDALVAALKADLPEWRFQVPRGGLTLWVEIDGPHAEWLAELAETAGVLITPGSRFGLEGSFLDRIRLPYTHPPDVLRAVVQRLAESRQRLRLGGIPGESTPRIVA